MQDLILIDKPKGITSFDVIRKLRKKLGIKKMGHSGTLDPLATGLILIGVKNGTKKLKDLIGLPKTYIAEIKLGIKTNTGDMEGEIIERKESDQRAHPKGDCAPARFLHQCRTGISYVRPEEFHAFRWRGRADQAGDAGWLRPGWCDLYS